VSVRRRLLRVTGPRAVAGAVYELDTADALPRWRPARFAPYLRWLGTTDTHLVPHELRARGLTWEWVALPDR
jgi:hypothetical protein